MTNKELVIQRFKDTIEVKEDIMADNTVITTIVTLADEIAATISRGNKLVLCGNGGSASDALHFAGEIVGRFQMERSAWPAVVLNADVATMTAIANDYGYDDVFPDKRKDMLFQGTYSLVLARAEIRKMYYGL